MQQFLFEARVLSQMKLDFICVEKGSYMHVTLHCQLNKLLAFSIFIKKTYYCSCYVLAKIVKSFSDTEAVAYI